MTDWKRYERILTPLPDSTGKIQSGVKFLNRDKWERKVTEKGTAYCFRLHLKSEEADKINLLRMHRVGCAAEVWEDGEKIGEHYGSFTDWEVRLQSNGKTDRDIIIYLKEDKVNLSPFEKEGILGGISLVYLSKVFVKDYQIRTVYENGWKLQVYVQTETKCDVDKAVVSVLLKNGEELYRKEQKMEEEKAGYSFSLERLNVKPWSTEEPNLYSLKIRLENGENILEEVSSSVGFREVRTEGQKVFWNNKPLKLRGLCYREPLGEDSHFIRTDLQFFKKAGVNYLKSLFYPFSKEVMDLCDEMGILTEQSASAYKVGRSLKPTQDLPWCREMYAGQFSEIVKDSRNHVSTLLFCVGNESVWGNNFRICAEMARMLAPDQFVNFSYPMTVPAQDIQPDVWSVLYADWKQPLDVMYDHMEIGHANGCDNEIGYVTGYARRSPQPVLHEIYAHLPCYNRKQIISDYGIHEFWGETIVRFQEKMEKTEGTLGGSVMAAYDEDGTFSSLLEECAWGILDKEHQPKPEYYHLQMAFTGGQRKKVEIIPHTCEKKMDTESSTDAYIISEDKESVICRNSVMKIRISKLTGMLSGVWRKGEKVIENGPWLQITKMETGYWKPEVPRVEKTEQGVRIFLSGSQDGLCDLEYCIDFSETGRMETGYTVKKLYRHLPARVKAQIGLDPGGLDEFGIYYILPVTMNKLFWERNGLWEEYPPEHPGRNKGKADMRNKNDFESMKHNIRTAFVIGQKNCIKVEGNGEYSIRMCEEPLSECVIDDRDPDLVYHGNWYQMNDASGNRNGTETLSRTAGDSIEYSFEGTGIRVYGPVDRIGGMYRVYMDGRKICEGSSFTKFVDIEAASRGYEKIYGMCLAEIHGLKYGGHVLRIEVVGEMAEGGSDTWVSIDYLVVEKGAKDKQIRMILNQGFNYTRLVRGCYMKDAVKIETGRTYRIETDLMDQEDL